MVRPSSEQQVRIESLTDLVFGLALSVGALVLTPQDRQDTLDLMGDILWFVFSFLDLISVWLNYSYIMSQITVETPSALLLNLVILLCVSLEPFVLNVMGRRGERRRGPGDRLLGLRDRRGHHHGVPRGDDPPLHDGKPRAGRPGWGRRTSGD